MNTTNPAPHWSQGVFDLFKTHKISEMSFVPDGGHRQLIELCRQDASMHSVTLTTEEEGVAFAAGAFLGGKRAVMLMQSSGVGNCINMLSLPRLCNMPFLALVTMRGEWGEFNPWQVPMGQATPAVLAACDVVLYRADSANDVVPTVEGAIQLAFQSRRSVVVLLGQRLIGVKNFVGGGK